MTGTIPAPARASVFRGWWVLAGVFVVMTTGSGFAFYAQGVFLDALVNEQGFSVSMAGAGTGTFFVVSGVCGYYAGGLISRFDVRSVMVVGATVAAFGIWLLGQVRQEWQMFAVFVVYGGGYALAGLVPATSLVTRWFHVRRSIALSIASTGLSFGGIAITPLIAQLIDDRSLVDLAPTLAIAFWLSVVPVTLLLLRPSPEAMGLLPDGATAEIGAAPAEPQGVMLADAVRTRFFRLMSAGYILVMGAQVGALQHVFKLTKDAIDVDAASLALIVVTSTSVVGRLVGGVAASRYPLPRLTSVLIVVQSIGIAVIGLAEQRWAILLGVFILGTAMGNLLMLHPLLLADAFGVKDYPRIYGLGSLLMITGVGLGPFLVGVIRDAADYRTAFLVVAGLALVGLLVFSFAGAADRTWAASPRPPDDGADLRAHESTVDLVREPAPAAAPMASVAAVTGEQVVPTTDVWRPNPGWRPPSVLSTPNGDHPPEAPEIEGARIAAVGGDLEEPMIDRIDGDRSAIEAPSAGRPPTDDEAVRRPTPPQRPRLRPTDGRAANQHQPDRPSGGHDQPAGRSPAEPGQHREVESQIPVERVPAAASNRPPSVLPAVESLVRPDPVAPSRMGAFRPRRRDAAGGDAVDRLDDREDALDGTGDEGSTRSAKLVSAVVAAAVLAWVVWISGGRHRPGSDGSSASD